MPALAFKVIQAIGQTTGKLLANDSKWFLDLVAISTICDMVPLVDENRILVFYGLIVLRKTKRIGLQKLYEVAAIEPTTINTYTVGFMIGPRLNAPGRMERASIAYDLLIAKNDAEASKLAAKLQALNVKRQEELTTVFNQAEVAITSKKLQEKKVIVVAGKDWSDGVVGLVAGRLMEKYGRPSIVLSKRDDGLVKGSARSVEGFHLVEALNKCERYLIKYGGHAKAAGLTLAHEQLELLYDKLIELADSQLTPDHLVPKLHVDGLLTAKEISLTTVKDLALLEPHGLGNPKPIFLIEAATVKSCRRIGSTGKHLKLIVIVEGKEIETVAFGLGERELECKRGTVLDLVGLLDINVWQGKSLVQLKLLDWRPSQLKE